MPPLFRLADRGPDAPVSGAGGQPAIIDLDRTTTACSLPSTEAQDGFKRMSVVPGRRRPRFHRPGNPGTWIAAMFLALGILSMDLSSVPDAAAESPARHLTVALPAALSPRTIGFYLAQQGGAFAAHGLSVDFVAAGDQPPAQLLAEGKADLAVDIMPTALRLRQDGADIQHVAQFFQHAGLALYCRLPIRKPADLHGTSVGIWFDNQESAFYAWMSQLNISTFGEEDGVTVVRQKGDAQALADRRLDCVTSTSYQLPRQAKLAKVAIKDLTAFRYEEIGLATLEDGLYARGKDLKDKARLDLFARFLAGAVQGWRKAHDDHAAALHLLTAQPATTQPAHAGIDAATLGESLAAVDALVDAARRPVGQLDGNAYDRTVNVLLTGAPEPILTKAPADAVSKAVWAALHGGD